MGWLGTRLARLFAHLRRLVRALWIESRRIPEYQKQAERLTRALRRKHGGME
jgi:hypothetical protein